VGIRARHDLEINPAKDLASFGFDLDPPVSGVTHFSMCTRGSRLLVPGDLEADAVGLDPFRAAFTAPDMRTVPHLAGREDGSVAVNALARREVEGIVPFASRIESAAEGHTRPGIRRGPGDMVVDARDLSASGRENKIGEVEDIQPHENGRDAASHGSHPARHSPNGAKRERKKGQAGRMLTIRRTGNPDTHFRENDRKKESQK